MRVLALDIGSSSVKAGIFNKTKLIGPLARQTFQTKYSHDRAEVEPRAVLRAVAHAVRQLPRAKSVDVIALATMSPSWVAMDARGTAITPIVTHQDRRSVNIAKS